MSTPDSFVLPHPETAFEVSKESIDAMAQEIGSGAQLVNLGPEMLGRGVLKTAIDASGDLLERCQDYLGTSQLSVSVDTRPVQPWKPQRVDSGIWHRDTYAESPRNGLIICDVLPTQFAVGEFPSSDHPLAKCVRAGDWKINQLVKDAVDRDFLKIVEAERYAATRFRTDDHIHRSQVNETAETINRFFMRLIDITVF